MSYSHYTVISDTAAVTIFVATAVLDCIKKENVLIVER